MQRSASSRAQWARARHGLFALKIRGFLARPAAEATQIVLFLGFYIRVFS
jgi:hypothetical protein